MVEWRKCGKLLLVVMHKKFYKKMLRGELEVKECQIVMNDWEEAFEGACEQD